MRALLIRSSLLLSLLVAWSASAAPLVFDDGGTHNFSAETDQGVVVDNGTTLNVHDGANLTLPGTTCGRGGSTNQSTLCVQTRDSTANVFGGQIEALVTHG